MSYTIVIPDLHGMSEHLTKALEKVKTSSIEVSKIVFTGDYVDRGPDSAGVVALVRDLVEKGEAVALMGNHEDLMIQAFNLDLEYDPSLSPWWIPNGGDTTMLSYGKRYQEYAETEMVRDVMWLKTLPLHYLDEHRIYVHGFADPHQSDPNHFLSSVTLWERYDKTEDFGWFGKHVVHGHTPRKKPELKQHRTNLDTGACFKGVLSVGVFKDNLAGGPVDVWEITGGV